jgi:hypothetical protein
VAGPFTVQRTPRGLLNVIGNYGGQTPPELSPNLVATLESLQFYGLQQIQAVTVTNAAIATDTTLAITVPDNQYWILFHCFARVVEQVAMTFLDLRTGIDPAGSIVATQYNNAPFIAGRVRRLPYVEPYPRVLVPQSRILTACAFAGVANADLSLTAVVGVLG